MNKRLDEAIVRLKALPDDRQNEIADLLIDVLDHEADDIVLTPLQIAEIEQSLSDEEPFASEAEVKAVFDRLTKG
jgi:hypothetical protein